MKKIITTLGLGVLPFILFAQAGHIMQGIGATNMSMGGAATAQPIDINGALQWNPAAISAFDSKIISVNAGIVFFFTGFIVNSAYAWWSNEWCYKGCEGSFNNACTCNGMGQKNSKHTFGVSAFGISGFGVTFPKAIPTQLTCLKVQEALDAFNQITNFSR